MVGTAARPVQLNHEMRKTQLVFPKHEVKDRTGLGNGERNVSVRGPRIRVVIPCQGLVVSIQHPSHGIAVFRAHPDVISVMWLCKKAKCAITRRADVARADWSSVQQRSDEGDTPAREGLHPGTAGKLVVRISRFLRSHFYAHGTAPAPKKADGGPPRSGCFLTLPTGFTT